MTEEMKKEEFAPMLEPIEQMLDRLQVGAIYGEPTKEGDITIIPVAEITVGFGYGYGFGKSPTRAEEEETEEAAEPSIGGGSGGGGGGGAKPRGYIQITPEGVSFETILDETRIAIAGIAMSAWTIFWITKTVRAFAKALGKKAELAAAKS